jgi:hypothetical protein
MPFEGQMQPMANGLDGGIRWTDDKQGVVYQIWGSSYRLWNPITLVSDVAVDIQVSFPTARLGNLKDRLAGVSSVETPHGEQTFKKIVTEVGEAQSWNTLRDTDRSHELTRDGLTLLKNFMLKTPMFS